MINLIGIRKVADILGVHIDTVRGWERAGKISSVRTPGNHRRYDERQILKIAGSIDPDETSETVLYARVSSSGQKTSGDLDRQVERLIDYCEETGVDDYLTLTDVGSAISQKRRNFVRLFKLAYDRKISKIIVEHKDRLTRFHFDVYRYIFKLNGVELVVVNEGVSRTGEQELVDDIIMLMTSFSTRMYDRLVTNRKNRV